MTSMDIRNMSEDELLDMDYFLNEDELFDDEAGVEGFYIFWISAVLSACPPLCGLFSFKESPKSNFPIKQKNTPLLVFH